MLLMALGLPPLGFGRVTLPEWSSGDAKKYADPGTAPLGVGLWPEGMALDDREVISKTDSIAKADAAAKSGLADGQNEPLVYRVDDNAPKGTGTALPTGPVGVIEFTPMRLMGSPIEIRTGANRPMVAVAETLRLYFTQRPVDFLVDPLALLTEQKSNDVSRFLEYHSEEAPFDICMIVLRENETVPDDLALAAIHKQWFGEKQVALAVYPFGRPRDIKFEFGPAVADSVSPSVMSRIEQSVIAEASIGLDPSDQVERLSIELSIRLYWLARILDRPQSMTEAEAEVAADEHRTASVENGGEPVGNPGMRWLWTFLGALLALAVGAFVWWLARRNSLYGGPVFFPDREIPIRLGGASSGGACAEISFRFGGDQERGKQLIARD